MNERYRLIDAKSPDAISRIASEMIKDGWTPFGSHQVTSYVTKGACDNVKVWFAYTQAFIRGA